MKHKKEIYSMKRGTRIYLASPLGAETNEEIKANMEDAGKKLLVCKAVYKKCKFVAPHTWFPRFLDDNNLEERAFALECGQRILGFCDAILLCGPRISSGMEAELRAAVRAGKECFAEDQLYKDAAEIETDEKLRMEENVNE